MSETHKAETMSLEIGRRLRSARTAAGMKLSELAERTNLSVGFLSRLERGQSSTSIANFIQITEVFGLGLHELFSEHSAPARTDVTVHRATSEMDEMHSTGYRWRHLAGGAPLDRMEVFHLVFPRRERMRTMVSHPGQEHCYVLSGEILYFVGNAKHRLRAGDGIFIDSELPHRAENAGEEEAHVLMAVSKTVENPVSFDWWRLPVVNEPEKPAEKRNVEEGENTL